jgi:hypothetical protein
VLITVVILVRVKKRRNVKQWTYLSSYGNGRPTPRYSYNNFVVLYT